MRKIVIMTHGQMAHGILNTLSIFTAVYNQSRRSVLMWTTVIPKLNWSVFSQKSA